MTKIITGEANTRLMSNPKFQTKMNSKNGFIKLIFTVFFVIFLLSNFIGCLKLSLTDQERLRKRLEKRMDILISAIETRDAKKMYEMFSKRYKKRISPFEFGEQMVPKNPNAKIKKGTYKIDKIDFSNNYSEAMVQYSMVLIVETPMVPYSPRTNFSVNDRKRWVFEDDDWYREPQRVLEDVSGHRFYTYKY